MATKVGIARRCYDRGPYAGNQFGYYYRCNLRKGHKGSHQFTGPAALVQWPQKKNPPTAEAVRGQEDEG